MFYIPRSSSGSSVFPLLVALTIAACIFVMLVTVLFTKPRPSADPIFHEGQMVRMKAFGNEGMVVRTYCFATCQYEVRFSSMRLDIPNGGIFNNGGPVDFSPVSKVTLREFELEPIGLGSK